VAPRQRYKAQRTRDEGGSFDPVSTLTEDLQAVVSRVRAAAAAAGELRPAHIGPVQSVGPERLRLAIGEDLASGAYHQSARAAVAGDPDLAQA